uniref:Mitochondrial carrier homolog 2 (Trinotate prediction) n=1 Tax=Myxobolus squamalis TaxID=59785 RepID=A0A6B2G5G5_MYXSQ
MRMLFHVTWWRKMYLYDRHKFLSNSLCIGSSIALSTLLQPLSVVKILKHTGYQPPPLSDYNNTCSALDKIFGNFSYAKQLHSLIGVRGFYVGFPSRLAGNFIFNMVEQICTKRLEKIEIFKLKTEDTTIFDDGSYNECESPTFSNFLCLAIKRLVANAIACVPCQPFYGIKFSPS